MGQIENMQQSDVDALKKQLEELNKLPREVPMTLKTFPMENLEFAKRLTALEKQIDSILTKLNNIFGSYVLINGKFTEVNLSNPGQNFMGEP